MKFLGALTIAVLATASGLPKPVVADTGVLPLSPPVGVAAQARRTPVLHGEWVLVIAGTTHVPDGWGYDSVGRLQPTPISGFTTWESCKSAGLQIQSRFNTDGYTLDFVCVPLEAK